MSLYSIMQYSKLTIGDLDVCIVYCAFEVENMQLEL